MFIDKTYRILSKLFRSLLSCVLPAAPRWRGREKLCTFVQKLLHARELLWNRARLEQGVGHDHFAMCLIWVVGEKEGKRGTVMCLCVSFKEWENLRDAL